MDRGGGHLRFSISLNYKNIRIVESLVRDRTSLILQIFRVGQKISVVLYQYLVNRRVIEIKVLFFKHLDNSLK